jgi:hypothetical protein
LFDASKGKAGYEKLLTEHSGLMGSAYKRKAEHLFRLSVFYKEKAATPDADAARVLNEKAFQAEQESKESLGKSTEWYKAGFSIEPPNHWTGMQYLSLIAITKGTLEGRKEVAVAGVVKFMAEKNENAVSNDPMTRIWAWGTLIEYYLLEPLTVPGSEFAEVKDEALAKAEAYAEKLAEAGFDPRIEKKEILFAQETTLRQIDRYTWWWPVMYKETFRPELKEMAEKIKRVLKGA